MTLPGADVSRARFGFSTLVRYRGCSTRAEFPPAARAPDSRAARCRGRAGRRLRGADGPPTRPRRAGSRPRASRPAMMPASTSPEPAVARPISPSSRWNAAPSGPTMWVRADFSTAMTPKRVAARRALASGSASISAISVSSSRAISPGCGVITARAPWSAAHWSTPLWDRPARATASRTAGVCPVCRNSAAISVAAASWSIMPGPARIARQSRARAARSSVSPGSMPPEVVSAIEKTRASGIATARGRAIAAGTASCTFPAPARSAAVAASSAAPGTSGLPATTSTRPRASLSPCSSGPGIGCCRSTAGVSITEPVIVRELRQEARP